jgi:hypothetical protein
MFLRTPPEQLLANLGETQVIQAISLSMLTTCITLAITVIWDAGGLSLSPLYFPFGE